MLLHTDENKRNRLLEKLKAASKPVETWDVSRVDATSSSSMSTSVSMYVPPAPATKKGSKASKHRKCISIELNISI